MNFASQVDQVDTVQVKEHESHIVGPHPATAHLSMPVLCCEEEGRPARCFRPPWVCNRKEQHSCLLQLFRKKVVSDIEQTRKNVSCKGLEVSSTYSKRTCGAAAPLQHLNGMLGGV